MLTLRWGALGGAIVLCSLCGCGGDAPDRLRVEIRTRGLSKLAFVIAYDQGLYRKRGLDIELFMPPPEFDSGIEVRGGWLEHLRRGSPPPFDIIVDGGTPMIVNIVTNASAPDEVILASTDCSVRLHVIGRKELDRLEDLKGRRIGVSAHMRTTTSFVALLLAQRMGWYPVQDVSLLRNGHHLDALRSGRVDALIANERTFAMAVAEGFPVLADTSSWGESIAGNSVRVQRNWLDNDRHRDLARKFLQASAEGLALFHRDAELATDVLVRWHGLPIELARTAYARGASFPRKPYPCYEGIRKTMELYDSNEMRRFEPEHFYDDSLLRDIDESGFLDRLYE